MTGYNAAHGDTAAVQLDLNNDYGLYTSYMGIISRVCWFDDDDNTWNDVRKAAGEVREFVTELRANSAREGHTGEIFDADLESVNWTEIVTDVLAEKNLEDGRNSTVGLE